MTRFFSIDIEASGPVPGLYSMVSLGCTRILCENGRYKTADTFYMELKPAAPGFDPQAMSIHRLDPERLRREGLEPAQAMRRWVAFVRDGPAEAERCVFIGHNAAFDWAFVNYTFCACGIENPFGHAPLDIKSLAMGVLELSWEKSVMAEVIQKLPGLPVHEKSKAHRADYDAWYQAEVFCALMNRMAASSEAGTP